MRTRLARLIRRVAEYLALAVAVVQYRMELVADRLDPASWPRDGSGEPGELAGLPREVRALVHAVDRMRDDWAEGDDALRKELWTAVHTASDAVWSRLDKAG